MRSYIKNSVGDYVGYEVGRCPVSFPTEREAIDWCMETATTYSKQKYAEERRREEDALHQPARPLDVE